MAPEAWVERLSRACLFVTLAMVSRAPAAHALRIVDHNVTNYPSVLGSARNPHFRTIQTPLAADIVVIQELQSQAGADSFRLNVLNVIEPGQWSAATFTNGNDTDNMLFYKPARVTLVSQRAFYVSVDATRLVNEYRLKPVGYTSAAAELRIYSVHLKASSGSTNEQQRLREATGLRDTINNTPPGTHAIVMGDYNVYSGTEPAFLKLLESQGDNDGRLYDPLNAPASIWNTVGLAAIHTQSPCSTCPTGSGFASGGLDDRFDMFLPTYNMNDGDGLDLLVSTYQPVGNDGLHYNLNITDAPTIPEGPAYANALWNASDHLPIRVDIMLPARQTVSGGPFALGTVITGATATTNLTVGNPATPPGGSFTRLAGPGSDSHSIGMDTSTPGGKTGTATVHSNSLDAPTFNVGLSGTVLRHASPSLDSASVVTASALDFGVHDPDGFTDGEVRLHNQGYNALQAQLAVASASITGGDGRFTIVGGTAPIQLAGIGETWTIHFDDAGATRDSLYEATLVIQSADQALPGGVALADVQVTLTAQLTPGSTTGTGAGDVPTTTRLQAPFPNPLRGTSTVHFDLARAADVRLEVFDLSGRRVATLASHAFAPGRWSATWNGRHDSGAPAGAGLYFVRMSGAGLPMQTARLAVVR
jgi:endonuclease/exonuclease/phosphatase family metal-dependent hydrolase